jgi:hypothetical protein
MVKNMKPSNDQIDIALEDTRYSSLTKALAEYARNPAFPRFVRMEKLVDQLNVADADKVGFILYLVNIALNGSNLPGCSRDEGGWSEALTGQDDVNNGTLQDVYSNKMQRKTIDGWNAAAKAINDYFVR